MLADGNGGPSTHYFTISLVDILFPPPPPSFHASKRLLRQADWQDQLGDHSYFKLRFRLSIVCTVCMYEEGRERIVAAR